MGRDVSKIVATPRKHGPNCWGYHHERLAVVSAHSEIPSTSTCGLARLLMAAMWRSFNSPNVGIRLRLMHARVLPKGLCQAAAHPPRFCGSCFHGHHIILPLSSSPSTPSLLCSPLSTNSSAWLSHNFAASSSLSSSPSTLHFCTCHR